MNLRILIFILAVGGLAVAQEKATPRVDRGKTPAATPAQAKAVPATPAAAKPTPSTPVPSTPPATAAARLSEAISTVAAQANSGLPPGSTDDVPARKVADFFAMIAKGQIDEAYANLTKGSKTIEKPEDLRVLKQKTREAIEVFGTISGHELVESKPVGTRLLRRTYVSLGAEFPLRWRFYFYNANDRWRLIDLRVDDRLAGMFDEPKEQPDEAKQDRP